MTERSGRSERRGNVRSLQDAMRRMRVVTTERTDGIADLSAAERARLELLAEELADVFGAVPPEADFFAFSVSATEPPRLWIDMTTHVVMARDRRTYRFLKDTRLGRTVILETPALDGMADCVTDYVAERLLEREKGLEGDWLLARARQADHGAAPDPADAVAPVAAARPPIWTHGVSFLAGAAGGMLGLVAFAWLRAGG